MPRLHGAGPDESNNFFLSSFSSSVSSSSEIHSSNMGRPMKRARLLEDDADASGDDDAILTVNEDYAKRFKHNKEREDRMRLEEKYGKDTKLEESESSSEDEDEDDDAELVTHELDNEIFETLKAIRSKDPRIYDKNSKFYSAEETAAANAAIKKSKEKPVFLADYHRKNLLAGGIDGEDADGDAPMTYADEQATAKRNLLAQAEDAEDPEEEEDDFLVAKPKKTSQITQIKNVAKDLPEPDIKAADADPETFLNTFMASRAWKPSTNTTWQAFESEDEEDVEQAEAWEEAYNLRFEDPAKANEKLMSHSRDAAAKYSVRREELTGRGKKRESEKAQKAAIKAERNEEKARLRRLKIEEAQEKLNKFREVAGLRAQDVSVEEWAKFLEAGFEDDQWEEEMRRRFGEEYYAEGDGGVDDEAAETAAQKNKKSKLKKPKFDDDIDIADLVPDFDEEEERVKGNYVLSDDEGGNEDNGVPVDSDDAATAPTQRKHDKKSREQARHEARRQSRKDRQKIEEIVDAHLTQNPSLTTSAQPSRFRYRETSPTTYGLSALDILMAEDAQLNQYVGLKKLASFRDAEKKKKDKKRLGKKARLREWRKDAFGNESGPREDFETFYNSARGAEMKRQVLGGGGAETERTEQEEIERKKSRRAKKRKAAQEAEA